MGEIGFALACLLGVMVFIALQSEPAKQYKLGWMGCIIVPIIIALFAAFFWLFIPNKAEVIEFYFGAV